MKSFEMLSEIIRFNRDMMATARKRFEQFEPGTPEFEMPYQIYCDVEKAFLDAKRMARYGVGDLEAPKPE